MMDHFIAHVVFLGQVVLISYYYPAKITQRMRHVIDNYPPSTYPKLYPKPLADYERGRLRFRNLSAVVLVAGLLIFAAQLGIAHDADVDNAIITGYFFAQFLPVLLLDLSSLREFKLMRKANTSRVRTAEIRPRRLFDFVSPAIVGIALATYVAFVLFIVYVKQFNYPWFGGYLNVLGITAMNIFFAGVGYWNIRGKKQNPHQSHDDRMRQIETVINTLVLTSITATVFVAVNVTLSAIDARDLMPVMLSLYFQMLAIFSFQVYLVDFGNFDVYKKDAPVT